MRSFPRVAAASNWQNQCSSWLFSLSLGPVRVCTAWTCGCATEAGSVVARMSPHTRTRPPQKVATEMFLTDCTRGECEYNTQGLQHEEGEQTRRHGELLRAPLPGRHLKFKTRFATLERAPIRFSCTVCVHVSSEHRCSVKVLFRHIANISSFGTRGR